MAGGLSACSSGSESGGDPGQDSGALDAKESFDDEDIHHLLTRTHFGVNPDEFAAVQQMGLSAYVDAMLEFSEVGSSQVETDAEVAFLHNDTDPPGLEGKFPSTDDLARWWLHIMVYTDEPFRENLAFFWHDHFAVSSSAFSSQERHWMQDYVNVLREQGTGNLRDFMIAMARDAAMAKWLDQTNNDQFNINENFAREFWELFTLGVDNGYDQTDIRESSEAFTGMNVSYDAGTNLSSVVFVPEDHADGTKLVFGQTIAAQHGAGASEIDDVVRMVDITLEFGGEAGVGVAEFVCGKLLEHYYGPEPPQELVDGLAEVLVENDWELAPVLATLFKSEAFYSLEAKEGRYRSSVETGVGFLRATGMPIEIYRLDNSLQAARVRPTQPPDVSGWVSGEELLSSVAMIEMANLAVETVRARTFQEDQGFDIASLLPPGDQLARDVIEYWAYWLDVQLTEQEIAILENYMNTHRDNSGTLTPSLFTAGDPDHLRERFSGLLTILVQHPTYLLQ